MKRSCKKGIPNEIIVNFSNNNKMENSFKIELAEQCWKDSLNCIKLQVQKIEINVKVVRNFKSSLERFLNSTQIDLSGHFIRPPKPFDLFRAEESQHLNEFNLNWYIELSKKNLELNWIALNQSYGRMIVKMKLNGYIIK